MNRLNKLRKATSISNFDFSISYTKLLLNKLQMVHNSVTDFCFNSGESKHVTVNSYGGRWMKYIKNNIMCLNKQ